MSSSCFVRQRTDSTQYHEFEWNASGDDFDARFDRVRFGSPGTSWESNQQSAVSVIGTIDNNDDVDVSWTVEAAIPPERIRARHGGNGMEIYVRALRLLSYRRSVVICQLDDDDEGDPNARMGGVTSGFHTYEIYDILEFVAQDSEPIRGDFDGNGELNSADLDLLGVAQTSMDSAFDLTADGEVNLEDRIEWVQGVRATWIGDSNLDGVFDSTDVVLVFRVGKFETAQRAGWSEGDWNGDQRFDSSDIVFAFQQGGYAQGPRASTRAVPEPTSHAVWLIASILVTWRPRQRS